MENLKCETQKVSVYSFAQVKNLFKKDIVRLNTNNQKNWDKLRQRHEPNVFSTEIPLCLQIKNPDFVVQHFCTDEHEAKNLQEFDFYLDVVPIVEEYIVALLLAEDVLLKFKQQPKKISTTKNQILTSVRNPITQVFFTANEMLFFSELFSQKTAEKDFTSKIITYGLYLSGAMTKLSQFIGNNNLESASWFANQSLYWFQQKKNLEPPKINLKIKIQDFVSKLQSTSILLEENQEAESLLEKLNELWMVTDISKQSKKIVNVHAFVTRLKTILKPMIEFILSASFLLPSMIGYDVFQTVAAFICNDFMFIDSFGFVISQLFGVILPLKEKYKMNQQLDKFQPFEFLHHEAIESLRRKVWEPLSTNLDHFQNYNDLQIYTRDVFDRIFRSYIDENIKQINSNLETDLFFNAALIMDLNLVKTVLKKKKHSRLKKVGKIYIYIKKQST